MEQNTEINYLVNSMSLQKKSQLTKLRWVNPSTFEDMIIKYLKEANIEPTEEHIYYFKTKLGRRISLFGRW